MEDIKALKESYYTEDDYYDVKRFLELKAKVKAVFENNERKEKLKAFIVEKNSVKDDLTKIANDESYAKALGIQA